MKFARIGEQVFLRQTELTGEEFRLYSIICFHTWIDTGVCRYSLRELAEKYDLNYDSLCRHYKILRVKKWAENTKDGIRPLVGVKTDEMSVTSALEKTPAKTDDLSVEAANGAKFHPADGQVTNEITDEMSVLVGQTDISSVETGEGDPAKLTKRQCETDKTSVEEVQKLTKRQFALKDLSEPSFSEPLEPVKDLKQSFTIVRLSYLSEAEEAELKKQITLKPKIPPVTETEWRNILEIYEDWKTVFGKNNNARLTVRRARAVLDRLRSFNKYTVAEIKTANRGCRASPNHNGSREDSSGVVYDDLELICRSDDQVEKMIGYFEAGLQLKKGVKNGNTKPTGSGQFNAAFYH